MCKPVRWLRAMLAAASENPSQSGGTFKPARFLPAVCASSFYLSMLQGSNAQLISQYVETNSGTVPKGVEIWNQTDATIDFSVTPLTVEQGTNGAAIPTTVVTVSTGTLAPDAVMVIGTPEMGTYLTGQGLTSVQFVSYGFNFNGDDALVLKIDGVIKDTFGVVGTDPGAAWSGSGVSTANQNIQLKPGITTAPVVNWSDPSERYETVSTSPATLPAGLTGFGIAPGPAGPDTTPPTIASRVPDVGATGVSINPSFSITFDENIAAGAGSVRLFKENGASDIPVSISSVAIAGTTASFSASAPLDSSSTYYILVDATAFTDSATPTPNAFPGISSETAWTFTTAVPDTTPPVATLSPADDETAVPVATNLVVTYDEPVTAGSGTINLYKTGAVLVQAFMVPADVTVSGNTLTLNPTALLEPDTGYYLEVPAGVVTDTSPNANASTAITAPTGWNFTTRVLPSVVINQYYEGANLDRYIELKNRTGSPVSLAGYRLAVWSDTSPSDNEGWKSGTGTTDRVVIFGDLTTVPTIAANSTLLIANPGAANPVYAANSANLKGTDTERATFFDGDDSIVLYFGATNARANVVDVVSVVSNEAINTSFYRLTDTPVFSFDLGASIIDDLGQAWQQIATAAVDTATSADPFYLQAYLEPVPPVLTSFSIGNGAATAVTPRVTLNYTSTDGLPTEFIVSESSDFTGATWTAMPGGPPVGELSAGNGTKTLYFKIRNPFGESTVLNDSITRSSAVSSGPVLITQYYEGTSNNKYVELTNVSQSPVDLSGWTIVRWGNAENQNWKVTGFAPGSASGSLALGGTLAAGQTVILANSGAAAPIAAASAFISSGAINHTGDDSYGLYQGTVAPENLRDAASFTSANEGPNTSFVRIAPGAGFDFDAGTSLENYPLIWSEFTLAVVDAAVAGVNEHLGTYPGGSAADYAAWINGFFPGETNPLIIGFNADPDNDGIPNGVEALIGGNPKVAGVFDITELTQAGNTLTFVYPQARAIPSGVTASYEWSTDLINWYTTGQSNGVNTVTLAEDEYNNDGVSPLIDYQVTATVTVGTAPELFVRVAAIQP